MIGAQGWSRPRVATTPSASRVRRILAGLAVLVAGLVVVVLAAGPAQARSLGPLILRHPRVPTQHQQPNVPTQPPASPASHQGGGSSGAGVAIGVGIGVLVLVGGGALFYRAQRRSGGSRRPPRAPAGGQPPRWQPPAGPGQLPPAGRPTTAVDILAQALADVQRSTTSEAVRQQIGRLLEQPRSREQLIASSIAQRDQAADPGTDQRLAVALGQVGVEQIRADGARFDPRLHEAVGRVAAPSPQLHDVVASTDEVGYIDHGDGRDQNRVLRLPKVVVYWAEAGSLPEVR